jgi:iron complex outermembrane receptor protein
MKSLYLTILATLLIFNSTFADDPSGTIKGKITTSDGQPAPFVNVHFKGENKGTMTDEEGKFQLKHVKEGSHIIEVSFIGFQTQEIEVVVVAGQVVVVDITLSESSEQLQEVVVNDTRTLNEKIIDIGKAGIKPMDLPQSLIVIDKALLDNMQMGKLSDVLTNTSGIYIMGTTGGVQEEIAGRGFSYGSTNTFKNGVRFNNGVMPEMSSLERVEILKGSAAILFGNVAAGGVLNLVTKKPSFQNGGEISFRAGSYDFFKPSIDIYGSVNNSKTAAYRINTTYENAGSFRDHVSSERIYFNPSFLIKASKKTEVLLEGDFLKDYRTLDYGTGAVDYEIADVPRDRFLGASWSYYHAKQTSATATITHTLNESWSISAVGSYQGFLNDQFGTTRPNASGQFVQPDGLWVRGLQRSAADQKYAIVQVNLRGKFNTGSMGHQLLIGADHDQYKNTATAYTYANPAITGNNKNVYDTINIYDLSLYLQRSDIPTLTSLSTKNPTLRAGVYAQDLISIFEKVKVLAGIRYSYLETGLKGKTYDEAFSPRLGVVYQPLKVMSVFASYANSFNQNTSKDVNNKVLRPSIVDQFELGVKNDLFKGLLSANVTAYKIVNSNLAQSVIPIPADAINQTNPQELAGEVTSKGVEVDIMSKPIRGASFVAGYSYNDTRYGKNSQFVEGSRLRYNPSHTANASVYYTFSNSTFKNFSVGLTSFYVGERVAGRSTRTTVANDSYKLMPIPNYFLFDLVAGYSLENISIRIKIANILNELSYNVHDDNSVNPIAPRQFSATISYKLR